MNVHICFIEFRAAHENYSAFHKIIVQPRIGNRRTIRHNQKVCILQKRGSRRHEPDLNRPVGREPKRYSVCATGLTCLPGSAVEMQNSRFATTGIRRP